MRTSILSAVAAQPPMDWPTAVVLSVLIVSFCAMTCFMVWLFLHND